jgi:PhzF family phenazine biosynthesis protein
VELPIYQVDAFASEPFCGNPAAVCPLEEWLPDETLQAVAMENNLSETAFYVRQEGDHYGLRWFTPSVEVELCGHATLAAASVIFDVRGEISGPRVVFKTLSGELAVEREGNLYALDFPARPPQPCQADPLVEAGLRATPSLILASSAPEPASQDYFCVFDDAEQVESLKPDMAKLGCIDRFAVIATAPGASSGSGACDFVSRFFAPGKGIPEDPVTGRAHTSLIPYWSRKLGRTRLFGRQISRRGGELWCEDRGGRVRIAGGAVQYLQGRISLPVTDSACSASRSI